MTRATSQASDCNDVAQWIGSTEQVKALYSDAYKPNDYEYGFLETARFLVFRVIVASIVIAATMAIYTLSEKKYPPFTCAILQVVGICK
jgi:hypothetical protein